jgi:F-type H+-transporting ATPase subunit c
MEQDTDSRNSAGSFSRPYSSSLYRSAHFCGYHSDLHIYGATVRVSGHRDGGGTLDAFLTFFWAKSVAPLQCEPGCTVSGNHLLAAIHKEEVMKKWTMVLLAVAAVMLIVPSAFAQDEARAVGGGRGLMAIAAGFGMALAAFGGALGQGRIASAACEGMARNPGAAAAIRAAMILGLVFVETLALFTLVIIFVKI